MATINRTQGPQGEVVTVEFDCKDLTELLGERVTTDGELQIIDVDPQVSGFGNYYGVKFTLRKTQE